MDICKKIVTNKDILRVMSLGFDIKGILLGGSRMLKLETLDSDYDFNIVLDNNSVEEINRYDSFLQVPMLYLKHGDKIIHWYYISDMNKDPFGKIYTLFWKIELCFALKNDKNYVLLLSNDDDFMDTFCESILNQFQEFTDLFINSYTNYIQTILSASIKDLYYYFSKNDYHILICMLLYLNKNICDYKDDLHFFKKLCLMHVWQDEMKDYDPEYEKGIVLYKKYVKQFIDEFIPKSSREVK